MVKLLMDKFEGIFSYSIIDPTCSSRSIDFSPRSLHLQFLLMHFDGEKVKILL
jgi:hypothetical protein